MVVDTENRTIELTVPARAEFVRVVRLVMAGIANGLSFDVEEIDDLKTAIGEAYGTFHPSEVSPLTVSTRIDANRVVVELSQVHAGVAPGLFALDSSTERGMGMLLMKHLMDEMEYRSDAEATLIRLVKYRGPKHAARVSAAEN